MEPTQEQRREFWEWCGGKLIPHGEEDGCPAHFEFNDKGWIFVTDRIDLNNLFKYAVPKAIDKIMYEQECSSDLAYDILFKKWLQELQLDMPNYEGALFHVLSAVMVKEEGK
ncbi:hypothetical protein LCGC14_1208100 [marine sediment metagenome]|uniref:Uncharacterized protein n=1 Tax=marine sediment metagenome TaxID=412755 RepID=A0A0F9LEU7_9ZZZZ